MSGGDPGPTIRNKVYVEFLPALLSRVFHVADETSRVYD